MDTTKKLEVFGLTTQLARSLDEAGLNGPQSQELRKLLGKLAVGTQPAKGERAVVTKRIRRVMPAGAFGRRPRKVTAFGHEFAEDTIARMVCSIFCFLEEKGVKEVDHKKVAAAIVEAYPENRYSEVRSMIDQDKWSNLRFSFQQNGEYLPTQHKSAVKGKKATTEDGGDLIVEELGF